MSVVSSLRAKGIGHGLRHERFSFNNFGPHLLRLGAHLLFHCDRRGATHFRFGLRDTLVGFGLLGLKFRADVVAHIDIGDIDR